MMTLRFGTLAVLLASVACPLPYLHARKIENWTYEQLFEASDVVVIAKFQTSKDSTDRFADNPWEIKFIGVNSTFHVLHRIKGKDIAKELTMLHYRLPDGKLIQDGPLFLRFQEVESIRLQMLKLKQMNGIPHAEQVLLEKPEYLLFLKKRKDGRFELVSGPIDAIHAVKTIGAPTISTNPGFEQNQENKSEGSALVPTATLFALAPVKPEKKQDGIDVKSKEVKRFVANQSQIGYVSTRVFYTIADQNLVVVIHLDNSKKDFPIKGKVYHFAKEVKAEGLAKWLNNQHSDGLYADAPDASATEDLPADCGKVLASKSSGKKDGGIGVYEQFDVKFKITGSKLKSGTKLLDFEDNASVYVPVK